MTDEVSGNPVVTRLIRLNENNPTGKLFMDRADVPGLVRGKSMEKPPNILLLCRYTRLGASSRLRFFQYLPYLEEKGFLVTIRPFFGNNYLAGLYEGKMPVFSLLKSYVARFVTMLSAKRFDAIWVEAELFRWLPAWVEDCLFPSGLPLIVDYDDAIFHWYDAQRFPGFSRFLGQKINRIMAMADLVVVGNDYLGSYAHSAGARRIKKVPTVVDIDRYYVSVRDAEGPLTIGWIGTPTTAKFLLGIAEVLKNTVNKYGVRIVAVGSDPKQFRGLPVEVRPWQENTEVMEIQGFDIGVMPLPDDPYERGKCGYKLIQYMACGKPVVASPVGVNAEIVRHGDNGFLATTVDEWIDALSRLIADSELRSCMGQEGRALVESDYSLQVQAPRLEGMLRSVIS